MRAEVVDLFCGIGGLSYGFKSEGFSVRGGIDVDASCKFAFESNLAATFKDSDIRQLSAASVARMYSSRGSSFRVLIGCAPCAPFSLYTGRYRKAKRRKRDRRWELLNEFARLVAALRPHVVSMENVPRLERHPIFQRFVATLTHSGYNVSYYRVRADDYGVPQKRTRLVLFASRLGVVELVPPTHKSSPVTVFDAIGDLPPIAAGAPSAHDRLHVTRGLTRKNLERLKKTREGGSWRDWSEDLRLACHKKRKGKSFRSVYGRMRWDRPAPVITTQCLGIGNGRFGHPEQDRAISVREAALLQTFPKKFRFVPATSRASGLQLARQIGNAVPVRLARVIARSIRRHLQTAKLPPPRHAASNPQRRRGGVR